ncbi:LysR family transcriptional regulator [Embleya sp. MST-111070]|uniref:LysR family transcriptional regulator n=1 Tax=Embleya sp. MST-111070 TaxID=3398231 RepID=UPI003F741C38
METRLLRTLVELDRLGTMRAVAEATGYGTSAVSQQIAALERETGVELVERTGRTVRLTCAGRRFAEHAVDILAAEEAARAVLRADAEPAGLLKVAAYAAAISADLLPVAGELARSHPALRLELQEREPAEVLDLLAHDRIDLGFGYDYSLFQRFAHDGAAVRMMCRTPLVLAVPAGCAVPGRIAVPRELRTLERLPWVVNSRGDQDGELVSRLCGIAGFRPRIAHRADSLDLILDFVAADLGVAVVPSFAPPRSGVRYVPMPGIEVERRMFAITRPGGHLRPGVELVVDRVIAQRARMDAADVDATEAEGAG